MRTCLTYALVITMALAGLGEASAWEFSSVADPVRDKITKSAHLLSKRSFGEPPPGLRAPQLRLSIREVTDSDPIVEIKGYGTTGLFISNSCGVWSVIPCEDVTLKVRFDSEPAVDWPIHRATTDGTVWLDSAPVFVNRLRDTGSLFVEVRTYSLSMFKGADRPDEVYDAYRKDPFLRYNQFEFQVGHFSWPNERKSAPRKPHSIGLNLAREATMFASFMAMSNIGDKDTDCKATRFENFNVNEEVDRIVAPVLRAMAKKEGLAASDERIVSTVAAVKQAPAVRDGGLLVVQQQYERMKAQAKVDYPGHECAVVSATLRQLVREKLLAIDAIAQRIRFESSK